MTRSIKGLKSAYCFSSSTGNKTVSSLLYLPFRLLNYTPKAFLLLTQLGVPLLFNSSETEQAHSHCKGYPMMSCKTQTETQKSLYVTSTGSSYAQGLRNVTVILRVDSLTCVGLSALCTFKSTHTGWLCSESITFVLPT